MRANGRHYPGYRQDDQENNYRQDGEWSERFHKAPLFSQLSRETVPQKGAAEEGTMRDFRYALRRLGDRLD
jgi:hypothetical protein